MVGLSVPAEVTAILLDIEGTTKPIAFVKDILFPYIKENVQEYLQTHWEEEDCRQDVRLLRKQVLRRCSARSQEVESRWNEDTTLEASAAEEADVHVAVVVRPGNAGLTDDEKTYYRLISSFSGLRLTLPRRQGF